jgi:hypothetical protein
LALHHPRILEDVREEDAVPRFRILEPKLHVLAGSENAKKERKVETAEG